MEYKMTTEVLQDGAILVKMEAGGLQAQAVCSSHHLVRDKEAQLYRALSNRSLGTNLSPGTPRDGRAFGG